MLYTTFLSHNDVWHSQPIFKLLFILTRRSKGWLWPTKKRVFLPERFDTCLLLWRYGEVWKKIEEKRYKSCENLYSYKETSRFQFGAGLPSDESCELRWDPDPVNISITDLKAPDSSSGICSPKFKLMFPPILISGSSAPFASPSSPCLSWEFCPWYGFAAFAAMFINMLAKSVGRAAVWNGIEVNGGGVAWLLGPPVDWFWDSRSLRLAESLFCVGLEKR